MARRRERAQHDRRLEKLAIEVLTALGEREATMGDPTISIGAATDARPAVASWKSLGAGRRQAVLRGASTRHANGVNGRQGTDRLKNGISRRLGAAGRGVHSLARADFLGILKKVGEPARSRTENQQIKSLLLCQLSYGPTEGT